MSFVYYRLPHSSQAFRNKLTEEPKELHTLSELNGRSGFVIAPFAQSAADPILLLPAQWEPFSIEDISDEGLSACLIDADYEAERQRYAADFHNYHSKLSDNTFQKIVLARNSKVTATERLSPLTLFARACRRYPRMFIALFSTERSGTWLVASPEILISGNDGEMQTMALAGTMRLSGGELEFDTQGGKIGNDAIHWSTKNIKEQRYVETYITECVKHFSDDFSVEGPYTARAGDLVHLRSDIRFRIGSTLRLGDLIAALHPTPAVCGMPKTATRDFIIHNESQPRDYYSGFSGLISPDGDTRLFVTLRCMRIDNNKDSPAYRLYAGGGLIKDSECLSEWEETEAKMNTMRQIFKNV